MSDCRKCAKFDWCVVNEDCGLFKPKPQTNADRIRSMTDEELARWIWAVQSGIKHEDIVSTTGWLDWLRQEAQE